METINTVVVARAAGINADTTATTPGPKIPNIIVQAIPVWQAIGVRVLRVYLMSLSGFLAAAGFGSDVLNVPPGAGQLIYIAAYVALFPAGMSLLTNAIEILTKLDASHPGLRA